MLATIIRTALEEHHCAKPGTVYTDPTTDDLFALFRAEGAYYIVAEEEGKILGGAGVFPTEGLPLGYAELVKLYLSKEARGKGIGKALLEKNIEKARHLGYDTLYLESFPELDHAVGLYRKVGFEEIGQPMGNSGHYGCTIWMLKKLS